MGSPRARQIARLQRLADGVKVIGSRCVGEWLGIAERTALSKRVQSAEGLLGSSQVATLKRASQLLKVRPTILKETLELLVNGNTGNCLGTHESPPGTAWCRPSHRSSASPIGLSVGGNITLGEKDRLLR